VKLDACLNVGSLKSSAPISGELLSGKSLLFWSGLGLILIEDALLILTFYNICVLESFADGGS